MVTSVFSVIPSNVYYALMQFDVISILWILLTAATVGALFVWLVFKADKVVELLKLEIGFDDNRIEFGNLLPVDVVRVGTFVIGGLIFIENVPGFLSHALFAFKEKNIGVEYDSHAKFNWAVNAINLIVGYLLITNYNIVASRLARRKDADTAADADTA